MFLHEGGTTGKELEEKFLQLILSELNLAGTKFFAGTADTTGNMNSFGTRLENRGVAHICCADHVLRLTFGLCHGRRCLR